ncbi:multiple sugar transport system permease protein [Candidatus Kryptobacter tengchongensis]|uniref:carbohydrate ABC transporter permease n=1 Tax=Kryptobacter tengchongensis TaxID=1643429 RepID=UPI0007083E62|nr:carbohydrate ABC transporter permease [Candidatus Kryptobacter tengchongensis]CUS79046.1 multiple sugar transport system permease protein [Candidatus Kryptobacter tengchongensis]CUU05185.1 multiple sugar transport system permease protein [Candidatus Kryptobacter tengchongensis]
MKGKLLTYFFLLTGAVIFAYPFLWMVFATLKPEIEIPNLWLLSQNMSFKNYSIVLNKIPIIRAFFNSLFVSLSITASVIIFGSIVGFALSRLNFYGKNLIFMLILFTMMIPFQITLIPTYVLIVKLGFVDTYAGLILPAMMSSFSILVFRQFFLNIPQSLIESARIDGCNNLQILFKVIIPLSKPAVSTVGILTFMSSWNEVLWPLIVIRNEKLMTMPQLVTVFVLGGQAEGQLGVQLASATLLALPVVIAYSFFQRYFIESLATTGLKE